MLKQSGFDLCSLFNPEDVLLVLIIPAAVDNLYSNHPFSNAKPRCQYPQYTVSAFPRNFRRTYGDLQPLDGYPIPVLGVDNDMNIRVYEMYSSSSRSLFWLFRPFVPITGIYTGNLCDRSQQCSIRRCTVKAYSSSVVSGWSALLKADMPRNT